MDEILDEEIFESWLHAPDLTNEVPWILRHSFENFQEARLMEDEKGQEYAPAPFTPIRNPGTLQDAPSRLEEPDFASDTVSISQDCLVNDQNSPLSTPSSGVKSTRSVSTTSEMPMSAILQLPCNANTETKGAKPGQDLSAELERPQLGSADAMVSPRDSWSDGPGVLISTTSLGIMLESARTISYAPSSSRLDPFFGYPNIIRSTLTFDGEAKEAATGPNAPMSLFQELPSNCRHMFISTPSLGVRLGASKKISHARTSLSQVLLPSELHILRPNSSLGIKLDVARNIADAREPLTRIPSSNSLHMFIPTPSLGIRLGTTDRVPGVLEIPSELGFSPAELTAHDEARDGEDGEIPGAHSAQDSTGPIFQGRDVRNVSISRPNRLLIGEDNALTQEYKADSEASPANSVSVEFLPSSSEDILLSTARDVTGDGIESLPPTAKQGAPDISLDDSKDNAACDRREMSTNPEPVLARDEVRQEVVDCPLRTKGTALNKDEAVQVVANDSDTRAQLSDSKIRLEEAAAQRNVQHTLSQCVNTNESPGAAEGSASCDIRDYTPIKSDIQGTPVIGVVQASKTYELASFDEDVNRNEEAPGHLNLPRNCDGMATGTAVSESSQQLLKPDRSPPGRYGGSGRKQCRQRSNEAQNGSNCVHRAQPAQNLAPSNQADNHGTNTSSKWVDIVHDSSGDLSGRQMSKKPRKKVKRVPVGPSGGSEKSMKRDSRVKAASSPTSPVAAPDGVDSGATQGQAHAGKSGGLTRRPRQASNETLNRRNNAPTSLGTGIGTDTGSGAGAGADADADAGAGAGTGGGSSISSNLNPAPPHPRSEVGASRAESAPRDPSRHHSGRGYRNRNRNRPLVNHSSTPPGHGWPQDKRGFQSPYRSYHGPNANTIIDTPATPIPPIPPISSISPIPPIPPSIQSNQSVQSILNVSAEAAQPEPYSHPRRVSIAANLNPDPAPAAAVRGTATTIPATPAQIMSLDASNPAITGARAGFSPTKSNAPTAALAPHGRRIGMGNLYANNQASAMASYNAKIYATSFPAAGMRRTNQAPYAPHDDEMIRPEGNWDASADDAAQTPIAGGNNFRIDLRKVRQITKLSERLHPRFQGPPQGLARAVSVQMAGVPINNRTPNNNVSDAKSPPTSPAKQAGSEPLDATRPRQAAAKSLEQARLFVPPHLRQSLVPAVPKLPLYQKLPALKSVLKPPPPLNGNLKNSDLHATKQADVPSTNHAEAKPNPVAINRAEAKPNPVADSATCSSITSQRKTHSDPSLPESVNRPPHSPKGKQVAKVTFHESNTPPLADSSDHSAKTDGILLEVAVKKVPNIESQHPLLGWDGTWQEAPVDWSGRPLFNTHDKHRLRAMNTWMEERAQEALDNPVTVDTKAPGFETGEALAVGEKELQKPINRRVHDTRLPDDDFTHAKKDGTAAEALEKHQARIRVVERDTRAAERDAKADRRAYREAVREAAAKYIPPPNPHTPRANIYIRPAILEDMAKIAELYNHYIIHSVVASERTPMNAHQWQTRWEDAREAKYAFLVAVQSSPRGGGYSRRTSEEVLAGFAYADDYGDRNGAWRFTCEIQFFVAHWQLRAGVGKSLVDRMLTALDPVYVPRNGVQFAGAGNSIQYEQGGERVVSKIMVGIPFAVKEDTDVKWQKEWLAQFEFEVIAIFPKIGRKLGKEVSVMWLHKETGSILSNGM